MPQVLKIFEEEHNLYSTTEKISLISNGFASIFTGRFCPVDYCDGAGTNGMNIKTKEWIDHLDDIACPGLVEKLGKSLVASSASKTSFTKCELIRL